MKNWKYSKKKSKYLIITNSQKLGNFSAELNYRDIYEFPILKDPIENIKESKEEIKVKEDVNSIWTQENISKNKGTQ